MIEINPTHIPFPSIDQFHSLCRDVTRRHEFNQPTLLFQGTVKLHGTNAGVCFKKEAGPWLDMWFQSRNSIITPESDNMGFASWAGNPSLNDVWKEEFFKLVFTNSNLVSPNSGTFSIFGEWCGLGIQKNVAINQVPRMFVIFGACYTPDSLGILQESEEDKELKKQWLDCSHLGNASYQIFNILDFPTYEISIDFNNPKMSQPRLIELTNMVEAECPVAKRFGVSGVGEGIVWATPGSIYPYRFKVKGEKHSVTKVKTLAAVDVEKMESAQAFATATATIQRFDQALESLLSVPLEMKHIKDTLQWVIRDILKEEGETLLASGLTMRDVSKYISQIVKNQFLREIHETA